MFTVWSCEYCAFNCESNREYRRAREDLSIGFESTRWFNLIDRIDSKLLITRSAGHTILYYFPSSKHTSSTQILLYECESGWSAAFAVLLSRDARKSPRKPINLIAFKWRDRGSARVTCSSRLPLLVAKQQLAGMVYSQVLSERRARKKYPESLSVR